MKRRAGHGGSPPSSASASQIRGVRARREFGERAHHDQGLDEHSGPLVGETLRSSGEALPTTVRADMESRFDFDLSRVRIHSDERAAASSAAIGARAYAVGNHIAFGSGRWSPGVPEGRHVLAHELAHVVQRSRGPRETAQGLTLSDARDPAEREADFVATTVSGGAVPPAIRHTPRLPVLQSDPDPDILAAEPFNAGQIAQAADSEQTGVCGPDVTTNMADVVTRLGANFGGWDTRRREGHCSALINPETANIAWDIYDLWEAAQPGRSYFYTDPSCALPPCDRTVQVGVECYYAGSANYVIFGAMCKLCYDHYAGESESIAFSQAAMETYINLYKGPFAALRGASEANNYGPSRDWAIAGYNGWPTGGAAPSGDRSSCDPSCPTPFGGPPFRYTWYPLGPL